MYILNNLEVMITRKFSTDTGGKPQVGSRRQMNRNKVIFFVFPNPPPPKNKQQLCKKKVFTSLWLCLGPQPLLWSFWERSSHNLYTWHFWLCSSSQIDKTRQNPHPQFKLFTTQKVDAEHGLKIQNQNWHIVFLSVLAHMEDSWFGTAS